MWWISSSSLSLFLFWCAWSIVGISPYRKRPIPPRNVRFALRRFRRKRLAARIARRNCALRFGSKSEKLAEGRTECPVVDVSSRTAFLDRRRIPDDCRESNGRVAAAAPARLLPAPDLIPVRPHPKQNERCRDDEFLLQGVCRSAATRSGAASRFRSA